MSTSLPASYSPKDPTPVIVQALTIPAASTGTGRGWLVESLVLGTGSATGGAFAFQNRTGKRLIANVLVSVETAGTGGTLDVGLGSAGTGSGQQFIASGSLGVAGVLGNIGTNWRILSGSGSPDSIVGQAGAVNSTLAGRATIFYVAIDS